MAILRIRDENNNIIEIPALKGEPGEGLNSIAYIKQGWPPSEVTDLDSYGIEITNTIQFLDENDLPIVECPFEQFIPLVAGDGVSIVKDEENNLIKISATTGGFSGTIDASDVTHGEEQLDGILDNYILNIDYKDIAFDTAEIITNLVTTAEADNGQKEE